MDEPVYRDDFERYANDRDLQKAYQVWEDGARINVVVYAGNVNPGGQAMQVEVMAPNPQNNARHGSIYHYLPARDRNWAGSTGVRFWVRNVSDETLLLSVNFKESFNEYWAVAQEGIFLLENANSQIEKGEIAFGNLPIPAQFSGYVSVPFLSFAVPDWNTARGDEILDLASIETLAFGITIENTFPHVFLLDDIELITWTEYAYLEIKGPEQIQSPQSGEHREPFNAYLVSPQAGSSELVSVKWEMAHDADLGLVVDETGWLSIPANLSESRLEISALYEAAPGMLLDTKTVHITPAIVTGIAPDETEHSETSTWKALEMSEYERFSQSFEKWAMENRPIFVSAAIMFVLLILWILSSFQKKIK